MGNIHVSPGLNPDQRIFRPVTFYDLIDLMTFSQITFGRSDQMRLGGRHTPALKKIGANAHSLNHTDASALSKKARRQVQKASEPEPTSIMLQSWALLDHEDAIDWNLDNMPESTIYLVSSVGALSVSLFPDNETDIFIEQTRRVIHLPGSLASEQAALIPETNDTSAHGSLPLAQAAVLPILEDDTVSVIVNTANSIALDGPQRSHIRLLVDLGTLLTGVIVYPGASIRFVELISQIVQRTTHAFVSRANHPAESHFARLAAHQQRA